MLFDSHAHYDDEKFLDDKFESLENAHNSGVSYIVNAASNLASSIESISLSNHFDYVFAAIGIHPHNIIEINNKILGELSSLAKNKKVIAIGEIGLDYYHKISPHDLQKIGFAKQINLAKDLKLPIIVHDREAHQDTMKIIKSEKAKSIGGVFHCFSGSVDMARELLLDNFYISIAGPVTYKNARNLIDVVNYLPMDRLLIETDSPYLSPVPNRGKRNDSSNIKYIAEKIAQIKKVSIEEIANITTENAFKIFQINTNIERSAS